jgi:hypothetical protein
MSRQNKKPISKPVSTPQAAAKSVTTSTEPIGFWQNSRLHAYIIFAICFGLYANTLAHDFNQDDSIVITDNMFTTQGISGFGGILGNDTFYGFFKEEGKAALVAGGRYRPNFWQKSVYWTFDKCAFIRCNVRFDLFFIAQNAEKSVFPKKNRDAGGVIY